MLVIVPPYGANIDSHVYEKMRSKFCDEYNLVVMQCDYFGNKFMVTDKTEANHMIDGFLHCLKGGEHIKIRTAESVYEFNDMGVMQALDVVSSTLNILYWLKKEGYSINTKKIILFGTSHGSYLSYLANAICPGLYQCIIDISSYITPYYKEKKRELRLTRGDIEVVLEYEQFLNGNPHYCYSEELYNLKYLYKTVKNNCKIISFHGAEDVMVPLEEKQAFISEIENSELIIIEKEDVDAILFKNAEHGLGVDFFELFRMLMPMLKPLLRQRSNDIQLQKKVILGDSAQIIVSYENGLPELTKID